MHALFTSTAHHIWFRLNRAAEDANQGQKVFPPTSCLNDFDGISPPLPPPLPTYPSWPTRLPLACTESPQLLLLGLSHATISPAVNFTCKTSLVTLRVFVAASFPCPTTLPFPQPPPAPPTTARACELIAVSTSDFRLLLALPSIQGAVTEA